MEDLIYKVLENYANLELFVVIDKDNKIILPTDIDKLSLYREIITSYTSNGVEYYDKFCDEWFRYEKKTDENGLTFEYFTNITEYKKKEEQLEIDTTTNLFNKSIANRMVNEYLEFAMEKQEEFAVIMGDVDFFKNVNDTYGHLVGDLVLKEIGDIFLRSTRHNTNDHIKKNRRRTKDDGYDIVSRFGGEEFLIVLKGISKDNAIKKMDNIREEISKIRIVCENNLQEAKVLEGITISFGMYHVDKFGIIRMKDKSLEDYDIDNQRSLFIRKADRALYISKEEGRNRITDFSDIDWTKKKVRKKIS